MVKIDSPKRDIDQRCVPPLGYRFRYYLIRKCYNYETIATDSIVMTVSQIVTYILGPGNLINFFPAQCSPYTVKSG